MKKTKKHPILEELKYRPDSGLVLVSDNTGAEEVPQISYEEILASLEEVSRHLEAHNIPLEEIPLSSKFWKTIH